MNYNSILLLYLFLGLFLISLTFFLKHHAKSISKTIGIIIASIAFLLLVLNKLKISFNNTHTILLFTILFLFGILFHFIHLINNPNNILIKHYIKPDDTTISNITQAFTENEDFPYFNETLQQVLTHFNTTPQQLPNILSNLVQSNFNNYINNNHTEQDWWTNNQSLTNLLQFVIFNKFPQLKIDFWYDSQFKHQALPPYNLLFAQDDPNISYNPITALNLLSIHLTNVYPQIAPYILTSIIIRLLHSPTA